MRPLRLLLLLFLLAAAVGCATLPPPLPPSRAQVVAAACQYLGTSYRLGGSGLKGIDCSGLVQAAYLRAGVRLPRTLSEQITCGEQVCGDELVPGDIVFFGEKGEGRGGSGRATHCGIYLGGGCFAHASSSQGVRVSSLAGGYWGERFLFGRRQFEE